MARRPGMSYQGLPGPQQQGGLGSQPGAPQQPRPAQPRPFYNASQVYFSIQSLGKSSLPRKHLHPAQAFSAHPGKILFQSIVGL